MSVIAAGTPAPEFTLKTGQGEDFTQEDLKGRGRCSSSIRSPSAPSAPTSCSSTSRCCADLGRRGMRMYGVSVDSPWAQGAFREKLGVSSEQLSDFEPKGAASAAFGVLHPGGFSQRALVITGADGVVRWSYEADSPGELPGPDLLARGVVAAFGDGDAVSASA